MTKFYLTDETKARILTLVNNHGCLFCCAEAVVQVALDLLADDMRETERVARGQKAKTD